MQTKIVQKGDKVKVHYTGKLTTGQQFDSSRERDPIEVNVGAGQLIKGFETALLGMSEGETKTIHLTPQDAYGDHNARLVREVDRKFLPKEISPQPGMQLQIGEKDEMTIVTITSVTDKFVKLDANHPLAGKNLIFDIEMIEIKKGNL